MHAHASFTRQRWKKLSKRRNPTSIFYYRDSGYLPEAFVNFLTLMGYSMPGDREVYALEEIVQEFDPKRIGVSGAFFDIHKLDWMNQQYLIKMVPENELWNKIREWSFNDAFMKQLMPLCHTRIKTFGEFMELCNFFFINHLAYTDSLFTAGSLTKEKASFLLQCILWNLDELENWGKSGIEQASKTVAEAFDVNHKKSIIPILYAAIMGKHQGPPLYDSFELLGKDRCRARLLNSIDFLGGISNKKMDLLTKAWARRTCKELVFS
ncbi:MAG: glutamate--tRNA ligase family protein [Rhabdochlamydiaceae bacterium]